MRKNLGFTLIELLVVIAIIAILAAILFPVMSAAKARASSTMCLNNLKQLSSAIRQYCDNNDGVMPCVLGTSSNPRLDWIGDVAYIGQRDNVKNGQLWPYVRSLKPFKCPLDKDKVMQDSYSMNREIGCIYGASDSDPRKLLKLDVETAGRASQVLLLIHESSKTIDDGYFTWGINSNLPSDVHYDGTNLSYCDGHVRFGTYKSLVAEMNSGCWLNNTHYYKR